MRCLTCLFLAVAVVLPAIWGLTGAGYFWPVWALGWWAVALAGKSAFRPRSGRVPHRA